MYNRNTHTQGEMNIYISDLKDFKIYLDKKK